MRRRLRGVGASWHSLIMAYHHVALATRDLAATHRFYTEAMGFTLVKAVVAPTDGPGGWAKHVFYDTGGDGLIAFWDLHDERFDRLRPAHLRGPRPPDVGEPPRLRRAPTSTTSRPARERWLDQGIDVVEIDHGFCVSIYTTDPNGILVECCTDTRPFTEADRDRGARRARGHRAPSSKPPRCRRSTGVGARRSRRRSTAPPPRPFLGYWPDPADDPGVDARPRAGHAGQPRRRRRARHPLDAARRAAVAHRGRADPPARRLQRPLRVPAARRRRLRGARLRHPLRQQRHRLPARDGAWSTSRPRWPRCAGAAPRRSCCSATAAAARSWRWPRRPRRRRSRARRRLRRPGRPPGRGRVHAPGDRPVGHRRGRPVLGRPGPRHVQPGQRLAAVARAVVVRPGLAGPLPRRAARPGRPHRRDRPRRARRPRRRPATSSPRSTGQPEWQPRSAGGPCTRRYLTIYRTLADPAYLDPTIDPDDRALGIDLRLPRPARRQLRLRRAGPGDDRTGLAVDVVGPVARTRTWPRRCRRSRSRRWSSTRPPTPRSACTRRAPSPTPPARDDRTYVELPGAPHYLHGHRREACDLVADWLRTRLP